MTRTLTPPTGWSVELLGLIESVAFENDGRRLMWSDGRWFRESRRPDGQWLTMPAPGVPSADSMNDARRIGCEFLHEFEEAGE